MHLLIFILHKRIPASSCLSETKQTNNARCAAYSIQFCQCLRFFLLSRNFIDMNEFNLNERKKMEQVFCVNALIFFHFFLFFIFQSEAINANRTKKKMWKPLFYHHFDFFNLALSNLLLWKRVEKKKKRVFRICFNQCFMRIMKSPSVE